MGFTDEQLKAVVSESRLSTSGHQYSSRRERIAAHLMAAIVVNSGLHLHDTEESSLKTQIGAIVKTALLLTDTLIIQLAED